MKNETNLMSWDSMTNDEKLDRLTSVLTRVGSDVEFRDRCLSSPESAKMAVSEFGGIEFPADFKVQFLTSEERMKRLVISVPDLIPQQDGHAELRNAEDFQICTYDLWRS